MMARRQQVVVKLKPAQVLWVERMDECLWPTKKLDIARSAGGYCWSKHSSVRLG